MKSFDLTAKRESKRRNPILGIMENLLEGQKCVHDHSSYKTPFSTWLAQQRVRLGKPFKGERIAENIFTIRVVDFLAEEVTS